MGSGSFTSPVRAGGDFFQAAPAARQVSAALHMQVKDEIRQAVVESIPLSAR